MMRHDLKYIYDHLCSRYPLTYTNTFSLDDGFTIDTPIIVGKANGRTCWLYDDGDDFVFSVEAPGQPHHDHWHPQSAEEAIQHIIAFMEVR